MAKAFCLFVCLFVRLVSAEGGGSGLVKLVLFSQLSYIEGIGYVKGQPGSSLQTEKKSHFGEAVIK